MQSLDVIATALARMPNTPRLRPRIHAKRLRDCRPGATISVDLRNDAGAEPPVSVQHAHGELVKED